LQPPLELIVGLCNPGKRYAKTRHNAGAWLVETLLEQQGASLRAEAKFFGLTSQLTVGAHRCHVLLPTTYMNESGRALKAIMSFYKINPDKILIAHDELDLPPGVARLKHGGGHGGHNGLRDIIDHLSTKEFQRIRIGIGHPPKGEDVVDYVLSTPTRTERSQIETAIAATIEVIPLAIEGQMQKAMHLLHSNMK
jgi:PTH1 family peptidyl-tRNA hydrolase